MANDSTHSPPRVPGEGPLAVGAVGRAAGPRRRSRARRRPARCPSARSAAPARRSRSWRWAAAAASSPTRPTRPRRCREGASPSASTTSTPPSATATARARRGLGPALGAKRKNVFLATKIPERARTRDAALKEVEASLKRLQTDHVDLLHVHSVGKEDDLAKIEAKDGVMKALYELREQKVARFIGMTSHTDGTVMAKAIERQRRRLRADGDEPGAREPLRGAGAAGRAAGRTSASC